MLEEIDVIVFKRLKFEDGYLVDFFNVQFSCFGIVDISRVGFCIKSLEELSLLEFIMLSFEFIVEQDISLNVGEVKVFGIFFVDLFVLGVEYQLFSLNEGIFDMSSEF